MESIPVSNTKFRLTFVLILVLGITAMFVAVIWPFLKTLLYAAIFAGLCQPVYRWLLKRLRGRRSVASLLTLLLAFLLIAGPVSSLIGLAVSQAMQISEQVTPWLQQQMSSAGDFDLRQWLVGKLPMVESLIPSKPQIAGYMSELGKTAGSYLVGGASAFTAVTAGFLLHLFVMAYAMFFFLKDGRLILEKIFYYMPLSHEDEVLMLQRFASVTKATVKGTLLIGLIQGTLAGIAFYFAGIQGAALWGTIMVVLSIVPGVGTALIYLFLSGQTITAIVLAAWCAGVVGTVDNVLRPPLVGKDARMPDLLIMLGTLGGLFFFGPLGFIVGPIVCGLFLTAWEIYGVAFKKVLPPVKSLRDFSAATTTSATPLESGKE
jgi:predicted PurR-regulated permease PerM